MTKLLARALVLTIQIVSRRIVASAHPFDEFSVRKHEPFVLTLPLLDDHLVDSAR